MQFHNVVQRRSRQDSILLNFFESACALWFFKKICKRPEY